MRPRPSIDSRRSSRRGLKSKYNVAGCWSRRRLLKQFQTLRRGHRSRHKLRPPPNCHRARASVRALKWCPAPCEGRVAAPSSGAREHVLFLRPRFRGENLSHHVHRRERALADRETQLHVFLRPLSVSIAAVIGGNVFALSCWIVIMSATEPMINAAASNVRNVTASWANKAPSKTATIGLT